MLVESFVHRVVLDYGPDIPFRYSYEVYYHVYSD